MDKPPNTNQPRVPLATRPIPGISTRTSIPMVTANTGKAIRRMKRTGNRSANQQAKSPRPAHITWRVKIVHGEPSVS